MKYTVCDKCGNEITKKDGVMAFFSTEKQDKPLYELDGEYYYQINLKYDLCERCLGLFNDWIKEPIEEEPPQEPPTEEPDYPVDGDNSNE